MSRRWNAQRPGARAFHDQMRAELRDAETKGEFEEIKGETFA